MCIKFLCTKIGRKNQKKDDDLFDFSTNNTVKINGDM